MSDYENMVELQNENERLEDRIQLITTQLTNQAMRIQGLDHSVHILKRAMNSATSNIGVPQGPYPANVAEAYHILKNALVETEGKK